jgi:RNA polymerase sigma factor (TIGR02999 family)
MSESDPSAASSPEPRPGPPGDLSTDLYNELRGLAGGKLASESHEFTLQATALVHEAWLKLSAMERQQWTSRRHFVGAAAETMRRILIDRARRRNRVRHGAALQRVDFDSVDVAETAPDDVLLRVDEALEKLAAGAPGHAELVKLRFFMGLSIADAAGVLGVSPATARRQWAYVRAWLMVELRRPE